MTNKNRVRHLTEAALIAAMYAALTFAIAPLAYGEVQFRVSEALTILPVFTPAAIPGLTVGCLLANLLGLLSGANPAGTLDMVFGTLATLLAALLTYALRNVRVKGLPVLAALPAVITNAVIVGAELAIFFLDFSPATYGVCALSVGAGELVTATVGGLLLFGVLDKSGAANIIFGQRTKAVS